MNIEYRYDELSRALDELVAEVEFICSQPESDDPVVEGVVQDQLTELDHCIAKVRNEMAYLRSQMKSVGVEAWK